MIRGEAKTVPISALKANAWNPNQQSDFIFEKELASIEKFGMIDPILVRTGKGKNKFEIVDGEHRMRACLKLGIKDVPVWDLGKCSDSDAQALTVIMNETRGKADTGKLADLMKLLQKGIGDEELLRLMPYTETEVESLLKSAEVDFDALSKIAPPSTEPQGPVESENTDGFRVVSFNLPGPVADALEAQVRRFKKILKPRKDPDKVSPVQAVECMMVCLADIPTEAVLGGEKAG